MDIPLAPCDGACGGQRTTGDERLSICVSLGLSNWEARTYLAVLDLGEAKASEIASEARISRGRIYDILERLRAKGVVDAIPTNPRSFRGVPPGRLIEQHQFELRLQAEELARMGEVLRARPTRHASRVMHDRTQVALLQGRKAALSKFREFVDSATREIVGYTSESCVTRQAKFVIPIYQMKVKQGVDIRLAVNVTHENVAAVRVLERYVRMRHHQLGNRVLTAVVVDQRLGLIIHWNPDDDNLVQGDDLGIASEDAGFSEALRTAVLDHWEHSVETAHG